MKLTKEQKEQLLRWGFLQEDFKQIERAVGYTSYTLVTNEGEVTIDREKAIELLGETEWLSGIGRSAFHWSAGREANGNYVFFDSKRLFQ